MLPEGNTPTCSQCGNPLPDEDRFCRICGTAVLPPPPRVENTFSGQTGASRGPGSADHGARRGGGYGCSTITMGALIIGFFVLIGVANGLDEGAGWAVVVFGVPVLVLSAVFLLVWRWAIRQMNLRNEAEAYRQQREEYLRELQIQDYEERDNN